MRIYKPSLKLPILIVFITFLYANCRSDSSLKKNIYGMWYGKRQAVAPNYENALGKTIEDEASQKPKSENVNLYFKENGVLQMIDRHEKTSVIDSATFEIGSDSMLIAGHYKTKVMKVTSDTLILYSINEPTAKFIRIFTRVE